MKPLLKLSLVTGAAVLAALGLPRIKRSRQPGPEGLEDAGVTRAYDLVNRMPQFAAMRCLTAAYLARLQPQGSLVDIGCGPGRLASLVARRFPDLQVTGLDTSAEMVETAAQNAAAQGLAAPRLQFRQGDVKALQEAGESFDFAVSTLSLHHWSDPLQALDEIHRILAPGGQLVLFDLRRDSPRMFLWLVTFAQKVVVPAAIRNIGEPTGSLLASYTAAELEEFMRQSQFKEWRVDSGPVYTFAWARKTNQPAESAAVPTTR